MRLSILRGFFIITALLTASVSACDDPAKHGGFWGANAGKQGFSANKFKRQAAQIDIQYQLSDKVLVGENGELSVALQSGLAADWFEVKLVPSSAIEIKQNTPVKVTLSQSRVFNFSANKAGYQYIRLIAKAKVGDEIKKTTKFISIVVKNSV